MASSGPTIAARLRIALAIVLLAVAVKITVRRFDHLAWHYNYNDFVVWLDWGTRYRAGEDIWAKQQAGEVRPHKPRHSCNQTPASVELFVPLTLLDVQLASSIWLIAQLVFLVLALWLVAREVNPPLEAATVVIFIALGLIFRTVRALVLGGSLAATLLLLLVISWKFARRGQPAAAGLSLAIATLLKLYPGALAVYFLLRRRWSLLWWTAGFFLLGVVATGISNWWKLPLSRGYTISEITRLQMNHVALLPSVYAWCASLAKGGASPWKTAIAITVILDLAIVAVLFWTTSRHANDSISDGLVFGLWLVAMVLVSPLTWRPELVLLFPAYIFAAVAALRASAEGRASNGMGLIAGAIPIGVCAIVELIKGLPEFQSQTLTALLIFIGTTIISMSWVGAAPALAATSCIGGLEKMTTASSISEHHACPPAPL